MDESSLIEVNQRFCDKPKRPKYIDLHIWEELPLDIQTELQGQSKSDKATVSSNRFVRQKQLIISTPKSSEQYEDAEFPANADSIDGRHLRAQLTRPANIDTNKSCDCGTARKLSQVFKDGPNQGRYFYSCSRKLCGTFAWADFAAHDKITDSVPWERFNAHQGWTLVSKRGFSADHVLQGGVGDCWWLSAVAVLAERSDLLEYIVIDKGDIPPDGSARFRLFLDGNWKTIRVDTRLPCKSTGITKAKRKFTTDRIELAYSRAKHSQLWVPLLEKAYAKAHGSYRAISGGHISEAMLDLTGCPTESIEFSSGSFDSEETWIRLLSFHGAGFPMGAATSNSGEGIVGMHAYSILAVRELADVGLGQQTSIKDHFQVKHRTDKWTTDPASFSAVSMRSLETTGVSVQKLHNKAVEDCFTEASTLRLVRLRNPWGRREWTGCLSRQSALWTSRLSSLLQRGQKDDGTFWMTYHDFLRRFEMVDVCKAHQGWHGESYSDLTRPGRLSPRSHFLLTVTQPTWLYLTLIQPSKRGRMFSLSDRQYWYSTLSLIVAQELGEDAASERHAYTVECGPKHPVQPAGINPTHQWERAPSESERASTSAIPVHTRDTVLQAYPTLKTVGASVCGARRNTLPLELHLNPGTYRLVPVHFPSHTSDPAAQGRQMLKKKVLKPEEIVIGQNNMDDSGTVPSATTFSSSPTASISTSSAFSSASTTSSTSTLAAEVQRVRAQFSPRGQQKEQAYVLRVFSSSPVLVETVPNYDRLSHERHRVYSSHSKNMSSSSSGEIVSQGPEMLAPAMKAEESIPASRSSQSSQLSGFVPASSLSRTDFHCENFDRNVSENSCTLAEKCLWSLLLSDTMARLSSSAGNPSKLPQQPLTNLRRRLLFAVDVSGAERRNQGIGVKLSGHGMSACDSQLANSSISSGSGICSSISSGSGICSSGRGVHIDSTISSSESDVNWLGFDAPPKAVNHIFGHEVIDLCDSDDDNKDTDIGSKGLHNASVPDESVSDECEFLPTPTPTSATNTITVQYYVGAGVGLIVAENCAENFHMTLQILLKTQDKYCWSPFATSHSRSCERGTHSSDRDEQDPQPMGLTERLLTATGATCDDTIALQFCLPPCSRRVVAIVTDSPAASSGANSEEFNCGVVLQSSVHANQAARCSVLEVDVLSLTPVVFTAARACDEFPDTNTSTLEKTRSEYSRSQVELSCPPGSCFTCALSFRSSIYCGEVFSVDHHSI